MADSLANCCDPVSSNKYCPKDCCCNVFQTGWCGNNKFCCHCNSTPKPSVTPRPTSRVGCGDCHDDSGCLYCLLCYYICNCQTCNECECIETGCDGQNCNCFCFCCAGE